MNSKKLWDIIVLGGMTLFVFLGAMITVRKMNRDQPATQGNHSIVPESQLIDSAMHRLDSLKKDPAGRRTYDSFMRAHPGILDSMITAQKYYQNK